MGLEVMAAAMVLTSLASTAVSVQQSTKGQKGPGMPGRAAALAAAEKERKLSAKRRGRASTLTMAGDGLAETSTLGRKSLLGAA